MKLIFEAVILLGKSLLKKVIKQLCDSILTFLYKESIERLIAKVRKLMWNLVVARLISVIMATISFSFKKAKVISSPLQGGLTKNQKIRRPDGGRYDERFTRLKGVVKEKKAEQHDLHNGVRSLIEKTAYQIERDPW